MSSFIHPLNGKPVADEKAIPYIEARMALSAAAGYPGSWVSSVFVWTYQDGTIESWVEDWDRYSLGLTSREWRSSHRVITAEQAEAIRAADHAAAVEFEKIHPGSKHRVLSEYTPKGSYAQTLHQRRIAEKAHAKKAVAKVRKEIERLYNEEGLKWEAAVALALKGSRLPRSVKDDIAESEEWPIWIEAYA